MMKYILILAVITLSAAQDTHTTLDDTHAFDKVVENPAQLQEYLNCFISEGPCTELTQSFKKNMPEAVPEACARCNSDQKHIFYVFLEGLERNNPQGYKKYVKFYDPNGDRMDALMKELVKYKN